MKRRESQALLPSLALALAVAAGACSAPPVKGPDPLFPDRMVEGDKPVEQPAAAEQPVPPVEQPTTPVVAPAAEPVGTAGGGGMPELVTAGSGTPFVEPSEVATYIMNAGVLVTVPTFDPSTPAMTRAQTVLEKVKWAQAVETLDAAIRMVPNSPALRLAMAQAMIRLGRSSEALQHAAVAWNSDPTRMASATLVVQLLCAVGRREEAQDFAARVASVDPKDGGRQNIRVVALLAAGEYAQASALAREILPLDEVNPEIMKNLARAYYFERKYEMALYALQRASEFARNDYEIAYIRALVAQKTQPPVVAEGAFRAVLEMKPDHPEANNNVGLILYETGNYGDAAAYFQLAFTYAPGFREARLNFANSLRGLRMLVEAEAYYQMLLKEYPDFNEPLYNLGMLYIEEEFGNLSKLELLKRGLDYLRQYLDRSGLRGQAKAQLEGLIKETSGRVTEEQSKEEDRLAEEKENVAKYEKYSPMALGVLQFYADTQALLTASVELATSQGRQADADAVTAAFQEFQSQLLQSVVALQTTYNNREGTQLEGQLISLSESMAPWMPKLKELAPYFPPDRKLPSLPAGFLPLSGGQDESSEVAPSPAPAPVEETAPVGDTAPVDYPVETAPPIELAPSEPEPAPPAPEPAAPTPDVVPPDVAPPVVPE